MIVKHLAVKPHTSWVGTGERCLWARSVPHQKLWRGLLCFLAARTSVIIQAIWISGVAPTIAQG
jgi:hypothetical protein